MVIKTIVMFLIYLTPYTLMLVGVISNPWLCVGLWLIMGVGMAGIGFSVMHDANHGSYSSKSSVNKLLGLSLNFIGANAEIWKLQHNVLHHTFTNVTGADEDIEAPGFLRFSPHQERKRIHRFQFLYAWFFYGLATISWVTLKEFFQIVRYRKKGLIAGKKAFQKMLTQLTVWKAIYYVTILLLPMLFFPVSPWFTLLCFLIMHFTAGLFISLIFQTAHVMPNCEFEVADENGNINQNWAVHEMRTTTNFAPASRLFSWYVGGLNYQIEHHLFPSVCHVHYRNLSKIVSATASEYGIPYNSQKSFVAAAWSHAKLLYQLGKGDSTPQPA